MLLKENIEQYNQNRLSAVSGGKVHGHLPEPSFDTQLPRELTAGPYEKPPLKFSDMEPTPVPALLQGRQTPSNVVHSSGRLPLTREDIERMMLEGQRGQNPLGKPVPRPIPKMALGVERPKLAPPYSNPLTGSQYVTDQTEALREQRDRKEHENRLDTDPEYAALFM